MQRQRPTALSPEQLSIAPYGTVKCRICCLDPSELRKVQELRIVKKYNYSQLIDYMKTFHHMGISNTEISKHFKKHIDISKMLVKPEVKVITEVLDAVAPEKQVKTSLDIERAYEHIVRMTSDFASKTSSLFNIIKLRMDDPVCKAQDEAILKNTPLIKLMEDISALMKDSNEMVSAVSKLRAPKVMVAQFLESTIDQIIKEVSDLLGVTCSQLRLSITDEIQHNGDIDNETFAKVFKQVALEYRNRVLSLKRENMAKAMSALTEMEKIV